jgi:hypothetical protein
MSNIKLTDVTIHIDKDADNDTRQRIDAALRTKDGVVSVHMPNDKPHLLVVEYNPDTTNSANMLDTVKQVAGHAELIGM